MAEERVRPRVKPYSEEAEQAVLGSILMDRETAIKMLEFLSDQDFYVERNQVVFRAMQTLYRENSVIDMITLKNCLEKQGKLEIAGGVPYIGTLVSAVTSSVYAGNYAEILRSRRLYRRFIEIGEDMQSHGYAMDLSVDALTENVEQQVFRLASNQDNQGFSHIHDILLDSYEDIETLSRNKGGVLGIPTGFTELDKITTGLQPADLVLVGARPSMGKTAFGLNIVQNAAVRHKKVCAVFSLEMSKKQCANRLLCSESMVDSQKIRTGRLDDSDWQKLLEALGPLSEAPIYIDDTSGLSLTEVRSRCRKLKLEKGLDLIMIDYLQLMSGSENSRNENRQQEISEISRGLKGIARELNVPVLALSQLSRALEARTDKRPMLSDLRESGAIEQDADVVMFLHREERYKKDTENQNLAEIIIAKQRNGATGTINLTWLGQFTKFVNYTSMDVPPQAG